MNKDQLKEEKEMEIDLLSLFFYLIQKWKILLLGAIIGGILAEGMTLLKTPMYQSTSTLYMLSNKDTESNTECIRDQCRTSEI